jgi:predicted DNA-binding transcriptional regulator AlpA
MKQSGLTAYLRGEYGTEPQVAAYLGLARITAQTRRQKGKDWPPAYRFGRRVMYRWSEVEAWAAARKIGGAK